MREHHREDERRSGGRSRGRHRRDPQDWRERPEGQRFTRRAEGEGASKQEAETAAATALLAQVEKR